MAGDKSGFEQMLAQIRANYVRELPERFDEMESLVLQMIQGPSQETFEALFRVTHSMKGSAGTHGFDILTTICHHLEDLFYAYQQDNGEYGREDLQSWLAYIDLLRQAQLLLEDRLADYELIERQLESLRGRGAAYLYRALIVTEHALDIAMLQQTFAGYAVDLSLVHDGLEGLERLLLERFDFYITSNQLPHLNGISIIAAIKQTPGPNRDAISVLLTSAQHKRHGRISDPDHVVRKDQQLIPSLEGLAEALISQLQQA